MLETQTSLDIVKKRIEEAKAIDSKKLSLSCLQLKSEDLREIFNWVKELSEFEKINEFFGYPKTEEGKFWCSLKELDFSCNGFGMEGAEIVALILPQIPNLKKLNLSGNNIGSEGFGALIDSLRYLEDLEGLDISFNNIGNYGAELLRPLSYSIIKDLRLAGNRFDNEEVNKLLKDGFRSLERINFDVNEGIETINFVGANIPGRSPKVKEAIPTIDQETIKNTYCNIS